MVNHQQKSTQNANSLYHERWKRERTKNNTLCTQKSTENMCVRAFVGSFHVGSACVIMLFEFL